jgi:hypothetical protein
MKELLKRRSLAEEEELLSVLSVFMSEIRLDMILRVSADWHRRLWCCLLMEGEYAEQGFNLNWFLTGLNNRARRGRVFNAHPLQRPFQYLFVIQTVF